MRSLLGSAIAALFLCVPLVACEEDSGCKDDYDCEGALVCKVSEGVCEPFECNDDDDCDGDTTCVDNACVAR